MANLRSRWIALSVWRRPALAAAIVAVSVLLLTGVGLIALISFPSGRAFVATQVLEYANAALGQRIVVGRVEGSWPSHFILSDVSVADTEGVWLTADTLDVQVRASALFRAHLHLNSLAMTNVQVMRLPAGSDADADDSEGLTLPTAADFHDILGGVTIERAVVDSLHLEEPVLGQKTEVAVQSSLMPNLERDGVILSVELQRRDSPGAAKLSLQAAPRVTALSVNGNVAGFNADGGLAIESGDSLSGALNFSCRSQPCFAWSTGAIRSGMVQLKLNGTSSAPIAEVDFSVADINEESRYLSELNGQIRVTSPPRRTGTYGIEANGRIRGARSALPELAEIIADDGEWSLSGVVEGDLAQVLEARLDLGDMALAASGYMTPSEGGPAILEVSVHGGGRLIDIVDDQSDLHATFQAEHISDVNDLRGQLEVNITNTFTSAPLLDGAVRAQTGVVVSDERVSLNNIVASAGAITLKGNSNWQNTNTSFDHISSALTVTAAAESVSSVLTQSTRAEIALSGPLASLRAKVQASTTEVALGSLSFAEVLLSADLTRENDVLTGSLDGTGQWLGSPFSVSASTFKASEAGAAFSGFELTGGAGEMSGDLTIDSRGLLGGEFSGYFADLRPLTAALGFEISGAGSVAADLAETNGLQSAAINVETGAVSTSVFDAGALAGRVTFSDLSGEPRLRSDVTATGVRAMGRFAETMTATAEGSFEDIYVELLAPAAGPLSFALNAGADITLNDTTLIVLHKLSAQDGLYQMRLNNPARLSIAESEIVLEPVSLSFADGAIDANFRWDKQAGTFAGALTASELSTSLLMNDPQSSIPGTLSADMSLSGPADAVIIDAEFQGIFPAPVGTGAPPVEVALQATVNDGQTVVSGTATGLSGEPAQLSARFPMKIDLEAGRLAIDMDAPASGSVTWNGELAPLWRLLPVDDHVLAGSMRTDVALAGSLAVPQITGGVYLSEGSYEFLPGGTVLKNLSADVTAENTDAFDFTLSAVGADRGTVTATGRIGRDGGEGSWVADIAAELDRLGLVNRDDVTIGTTGQLNYAGPLLSGTLSGELQIIRSAVRLDASYAPEIPLLRELPDSGSLAPSMSSPIALDVTLVIDELLRAEGRGLESVWRGRLQVGGDIVHPDLAGTITLDRGTFSFLGQTFTLDSGAVTFTGGGKADPELAITAVRQAEDITATVFISGRASKPNIALSSRPPLPQDEVLARLLFRKGSGQLGPLESVQLASAAADLSGLSEGGLNGILRRTFGLDVVSIGGTDGDSLVVGEQVGRNIYVAVEQNLTDNSRKFIVEWRFSPSISLQSTTSDETGADLGVLWRRDY